MTSKTTVLMAFALAAVPLSSPTAAGPAGGGARMPAVEEFCKELVAGGGVPWLSVGECIALNLSSDAELRNFWVHRCDNWRDEGVLGLAGYGSYQECVLDF